jgi:serine/threonine protein kinase/sugar lactone lactonase YvrE
MTRTEWEQVWSAYQSATELRPEERAAFLERTLADSALRQKAHELLAELEAGEMSQASTAGADEPASSWHFLGKSLGRFALVAPIGRGGMGEVYRALDTDLHRNVAIKCIAGRRLGSPDAVSKFVREARMASALNHPGIVTVYEVIRTADTVAIAMELAEGETLRKMCGTPQPAAKVIGWGRQIAEALAASHAAGLVHRDIKPENLMLRNDGVIKVLDFGLARRHAEMEEQRDDGVAGTLRYMSPEQALGAELSPATDVFSLGIVLYELAAGVHPFAASDRGNSTMTVAQAIASSKAAPRLSAAARVPAAFDGLVASMLSADPAGRPAAQDVALNLETLGRPRSRRWIWPAAAVLVAAAGAWFVSRFAPPGAAQLRMTPFTTLQGAETQPAFSPDGSQIAFVWNGEDENSKSIYIKTIGSDQVRRLTSSSLEDSSPAWSPDGREIAFLRMGPGSPRADVMLVSASGGEPRKVARCTSPEAALRPLAWHPDGKDVLLRAGYKDGIILWRIPVGPEPGKPFTPCDDRCMDEAPTLAPNGSAFAFVRRDGIHYSVCTVKADGSGQACTPTPSRIVGLAWTANSHSILYAAPTGLWRVPLRSGKFGTAVRIAEGRFEGLAGDTAGRRFAFTRIYSDLNIWRMRTDGSRQERLIASSGEDSEPDYSPDGRRILFRSDRHGSLELYTANSDGSAPVRLTSIGGLVGSARWSPDGRSIAFETTSPAAKYVNVYLVPTSGGAAQRITDDGAGYMAPAWSRDGGALYYAMGRLATWKMAFPQGKPDKVQAFAAMDIVESADGQYMYCMQRMGGPGVWRQKLPNGELEMLSGTEKAHYRGFALASNGVYFTEPSGRPVLYFREERTGQVRRVANLPGHLSRGPRTFALSPDGQSLLYTSEDLAIADIVLFEGIED